MSTTATSSSSERVETLESRRLAEILVRLRGDWMLSGLVDLVTGEFKANVPLGLIVDGVVFTGYLEPSQTSAQQLDDVLVKWVESANLTIGEAESTTNLTEVRQAITQALRGRFTGQSVSRQQQQTVVAAQLSELWGQPQGSGYQDRPRIEDIPDELVAEVVDYLAPRAAFSLSDAKMQLPNGGWAPAGVIRILTSHIGAWWVVNDSPTSSE